MAERLMMTTPAPLYDGTYDSLLLHGDGFDGGTTFTDSSFYGFTPTKFGTVTTSVTAPKFGSASILFGASGSYLKYAHNAAHQFGASDWCIDFWVTLPASPTGFRILVQKTSGGNNRYAIYVNGANLIVEVGGTVTASLGTLTTGTPVHIEVGITAGRLYAFINGTKVRDSAETANALPTSDLFVGANTSGANTAINTRIDELRIRKGIGPHTANFTPPTVPYGS